MSRFGLLDFGQPWWLALLALTAYWLWWRRRRRPAAILFSRVDVLSRGPSLGRWAARVLLIARVAAICGVSLALARPRAGARVEQVSGNGISIILAIDLSSSMLAEDFQPQNRIEVAKEKVKQFINGRSVDQVGLVAFSGRLHAVFGPRVRGVAVPRSGMGQKPRLRRQLPGVVALE